MHGPGEKRLKIMRRSDQDVWVTGFLDRVLLEVWRSNVKTTLALSCLSSARPTGHTLTERILEVVVLESWKDHVPNTKLGLVQFQVFCREGIIHEQNHLVKGFEELLQELLRKFPAASLYPARRSPMAGSLRFDAHCNSIVYIDTRTYKPSIRCSRLHV